jgi:hypothetical protein
VRIGTSPAPQASMTSRNTQMLAEIFHDVFVRSAATRSRVRFERVRLQATSLNEAPLDRQDVRLAIAKRFRRRVDRVVPQDEIVLVWSG